LQTSYKSGVIGTSGSDKSTIPLLGNEKPDVPLIGVESIGNAVGVSGTGIDDISGKTMLLCGGGGGATLLCGAALLCGVATLLCGAALLCVVELCEECVLDEVCDV
jgi:hypothetical protein